ncbi:hypothetical protein L195_g055137, partial [Trifolium pratense]
MKNSTNQSKATVADETNALIQNLSIGPSTLKQPKLQFDEINVMGNMTDIDFYVPDVNGGDNTGMAFCMAYYAAKYYCKHNKELCV